jgi:hypothetical protein
MAMDAIVLVAVVFTLVFLIAWLASPRLRIAIERPKYRFLADLERQYLERPDVERQDGNRE